MYHIWRYLEEEDPELATSGSILESKTIDAGTSEEEEMEANAFAGLLLVPVHDLDQQIRIYHINKDALTIDDILTLIEIFAVPYKAMVLRLLEEGIITDEQVMKLLAISSDTIGGRVKITGKAKRWFMVPVGQGKLGSLLENLTINTENESLPRSRLDGDREKLQKVMKDYRIE